MCGAIIGDWSDGEIVPPLLGSGFTKERMGISKERRVDQWFLDCC